MTATSQPNNSYDFICEVDHKTCNEAFDHYEALADHIMTNHARTNYGIHLRIERIEQSLIEHKLLRDLDE